MSQVKIVVFAKAPAAGKVKTRLIPELGEQGATQLAHDLLLWTCRHVSLVPDVSRELCGSPSPEHPSWSAYPLDASWSRTDQGEGDLGQRLARASERVLKDGFSAILIGTDCPGLKQEQLFACAMALKEFDCVMVPALDGGYVLLGLRRFDPEIFAGIAWSTATVAAETRQRIARLGWSLREWPALPDIDEASDLPYLPLDLSETLKR